MENLQQKLEKILKVIQSNNQKLCYLNAHEQQVIQLLLNTEMCFDRMHIIAEEGVLTISEFLPIIDIVKTMLKNLVRWLSLFSSSNQNRCKNEQKKKIEVLNTTCQICRNYVQDMKIKSVKNQIYGIPGIINHLSKEYDQDQKENLRFENDLYGSAYLSYQRKIHNLYSKAEPYISQLLAQEKYKNQDFNEISLILAKSSAQQLKNSNIDEIMKSFLNQIKNSLAGKITKKVLNYTQTIKDLTKQLRENKKQKEKLLLEKQEKRIQKNDDQDFIKVKVKAETFHSYEGKKYGRRQFSPQAQTSEQNNSDYWRKKCYQLENQIEKIHKEIRYSELSAASKIPQKTNDTLQKKYRFNKSNNWNEDKQKIKNNFSLENLSGNQTLGQKDKQLILQVGIQCKLQISQSGELIQIDRHQERRKKKIKLRNESNLIKKGEEEQQKEKESLKDIKLAKEGKSSIKERKVIKGYQKMSIKNNSNEQKIIQEINKEWREKEIKSVVSNNSKNSSIKKIPEKEQNRLSIKKEKIEDKKIKIQTKKPKPKLRENRNITSTDGSLKNLYEKKKERYFKVQPNDSIQEKLSKQRNEDDEKFLKVRQLKTQTNFYQVPVVTLSNKYLSKSPNKSQFKDKLDNIIESRHLEEQQKIGLPFFRLRQRIFGIDDLELFGGLSEAYHYSSTELGDFENIQRGLLKRICKHINNLSEFNTDIYANTISFLIKPYETVEEKKLQCERKIPFWEMEKIIGYIFELHKKQCGKVQCRHIQSFLTKILFQ